MHTTHTDITLTLASQCCIKTGRERGEKGRCDNEDMFERHRSTADADGGLVQ